jgi:hypothetical protein
MDLVSIIRERCPRDTGNLADHGVKFIWEDKDTFTIYVDEGEAPYMPYTNEPWISPKWNGKKNPNEAWWQDAIRLCAEHLKQKYKGIEE